MAVGVPVTLGLLFRTGLESLGYSALATLVAATVGGTGLAIWRVLQHWAYRKFTDGRGL